MAVTPPPTHEASAMSPRPPLYCRSCDAVLILRGNDRVGECPVCGGAALSGRPLTPLEREGRDRGRRLCRKLQEQAEVPGVAPAEAESERAARQLAEALELEAAGRKELQRVRLRQAGVLGLIGAGLLAAGACVYVGLANRVPRDKAAAAAARPGAATPAATPEPAGRLREFPPFDPVENARDAAPKARREEEEAGDPLRELAEVLRDKAAKESRGPVVPDAAAPIVAAAGGKAPAITREPERKKPKPPPPKAADDALSVLAVHGKHAEYEGRAVRARGRVSSASAGEGKLTIEFRGAGVVVARVEVPDEQLRLFPDGRLPAGQYSVTFDATVGGISSVDGVEYRDAKLVSWER